MKKFFRAAVLLAPLFIVASCGPSAPQEDPYDKYKPTEAEWAANIERIKTGNIECTFRLTLGDEGSQTISMKGTATKVYQQMIVAGYVATDLIVQDGENYTRYYKENNSKWNKEDSSSEEFAELKEGLIPMPLVYSNFVWGGSTYKMTNVNPIVVEQDGDTTTLTNVEVSITPSTKLINSIDANVTTTDGVGSKTGTMKVTYVYKDASFDIDVPDVK